MLHMKCFLTKLHSAWFVEWTFCPFWMALFLEELLSFLFLFSGPSAGERGCLRMFYCSYCRIPQLSSRRHETLLSTPQML